MLLCNGHTCAEANLEPLRCQLRHVRVAVGDADASSIRHDVSALQTVWWAEPGEARPGVGRHPACMHHARITRAFNVIHLALRAPAKWL
jgi:hypothetical protein